MAKRRIIVAVLSGALGASACSGSDESGDGPAPIPLEDLAATAAPVYANLYLSCVGPLADEATRLWHGEDLATRMERRLTDEYALLQNAVDAGRVAYHADLMPACVAAVGARACDQILDRNISECELAVEGTVAVAGACTSDWECEGTNVCKFEDGCPGVCRPRGAAGTVCQRDDECSDGLICFVTVAQGQATGLCSAPSEASQPCEGNQSAGCRPDLFCAGAKNRAVPPVPGTCSSYTDVFSGAAGTTCNLSDTLCASGLCCAVQTIAPLEGECEPAVESGATCRLAFPEQCPVGQYCGELNGATLQGTCVALPGEGEACARLDGDDPLCAAYLRCDGGTCRAIQRLGGTCSSNALCYSENCVDGRCQSGSVCTP
jgi:hypothetical protein